MSESVVSLPVQKRAHSNVLAGHRSRATASGGQAGLSEARTRRDGSKGVYQRTSRASGELVAVLALNRHNTPHRYDDRCGVRRPPTTRPPRLWDHLGPLHGQLHRGLRRGKVGDEPCLGSPVGPEREKGNSACRVGVRHSLRAPHHLRHGLVGGDHREPFLGG